MTSIPIKVLLLISTALYQAIACWREDRRSPPGQLIGVADLSNDVHNNTVRSY